MSCKEGGGEKILIVDNSCTLSWTISVTIRTQWSSQTNVTLSLGLPKPNHYTLWHQTISAYIKHTYIADNKLHVIEA